MKRNIVKVHPQDNVLVALTNLSKGEHIVYNGLDVVLHDNIPAKHKFVTADLRQGDPIFMYGVLVGKAQQPIPSGGLITTSNVKHASSDFTVAERKTGWQVPDVSKWKNKTFMGYHRADGKVGTANYWL